MKKIRLFIIYSLFIVIIFANCIVFWLSSYNLADNIALFSLSNQLYDGYIIGMDNIDVQLLSESKNNYHFIIFPMINVDRFAYSLFSRKLSNYHTTVNVGIRYFNKFKVDLELMPSIINRFDNKDNYYYIIHKDIDKNIYNYLLNQRNISGIILIDCDSNFDFTSFNTLSINLHEDENYEILNLSEYYTDNNLQDSIVKKIIDFVNEVENK